MPQELKLDPTHVGNIAVLLEQAVMRAINEVTSAAGSAVPVPADATLASIEVATKFAQYVTDEFLPTAADALTKLSAGAGVLPQIASGFVGADEGGGAGVLQAVAGGLGPLTGMLGTIPSMAQSMAQEAALTEEYAADTSEEEGRDEEGREEDGRGFPRQGATFV